MSRYWKAVEGIDDYGQIRRSEVKYDDVISISNEFVREYGENLCSAPDDRCLVLANKSHWMAFPHDGDAYTALVQKIKKDNGLVFPESNRDRSKRELKETLRKERDNAHVNSYRRLVGKLSSLRDVGLDHLADDMQRDIDRLMK